MKRYLLLTGDNYYPAGWGDFAGSFDSVDEAKAAASVNNGWAEIIDTETEAIVVEGQTNYIEVWDWEYRTKGSA